MQKQILHVLFFILIFNSAYAQSKYSRVKIDLTNTNISELNKLGLDTDHGSLIPGVHYVNDFSEKELALINEAGLDNFVLIDDLKADYLAKKNQTMNRSSGCTTEDSYDYTTPENYTFGSMGGYHTYNEMLAVLEEMHTRFPQLISGINVVEGIKTWENNDIIWLKVSNNPEEDEAKPEILYTALHHAREPNSLSQMIFFLWYLLENYETNPQVAFLVDHTEMYFMPCLNPDGYKYNELTDPEGGGFWRKNRRPDMDPENVGVDLNRNYGYFWGFDDFGSSPDKSSNTYRGPQGFSEPETQAVRTFCMQHNFQIALNYHTSGDILIHPWGYSDILTEEDAIFKAFGKSMTKENNFSIGTVAETLGYLANGGSDDYLYGEDAEKDKIFSFTPEVGPVFWPQESEIDQLNKSCIRQNLVAANLLFNYYDVDVSNIGSIITANEGTFDLNIVKSGLKDGAVTIQVVPNDTDLLSFNQNSIQVSLGKTETLTLPLDYVISNNAPSLYEFSFDVKIDNGEFIATKTYYFTYRNTISEEILKDDLSDLNNWELEDVSWGLTNEYFVSAPNSLTDSPFAFYENNTIASIVLADQISLEDSDFTTLKFKARWEIEFNYDYVLIQVSNDAGESWTSLCGDFTRAGKESHGTSDPLYDGYQTDWVVDKMDLSDYSGQVINLRLLFVSDIGVTQDGFYIDDIIIESEKLLSVGVQEELAIDFSIIPSLNNGTFDVELDTRMINGKSYLEVYTIHGQLLYKRKVTNKVETIALEGITKGMYIVKLIDKDGNVFSKKVNVIR